MSFALAVKQRADVAVRCGFDQGWYWLSHYVQDACDFTGPRRGPGWWMELSRSDMPLNRRLLLPPVLISQSLLALSLSRLIS